MTKQYYNRTHSSTKLTPIQANLKKNESYVYKNILEKRKKIKPKYEIDDLVRTADLMKTYSKGDTTNWSYKFYKITEIVNDTIASYRLENFKERHNAALLKKTELTMTEKISFMKKIEIDIL